MDHREPAEPDRPTVVLSEERLVLRTELTPRECVTVRKVVVLEERTIAVTVRREELRVTREWIVDAASAVTPTPPAVPAHEVGDAHPRVDTENIARVPLPDRADLVIVLHEERPQVTMAVVPVERVTIQTGWVEGQHAVHAAVRRERVDVDRS